MNYHNQSDHVPRVPSISKGIAHQVPRMNNGMSLPFRNGYGSGPDSFSHPRPPTRGGGGSHRESLGPAPTSSSLPPPPPPFPPPDKARQLRSSAASAFTPCNTPTNPTQIPSKRSSLPTFSSTHNPNGNNTGSNFPPPQPHQNAAPQPPKRSSSCSTNPHSRPQPEPLPSLPATIDEDDPMLDYAPETWIASMIGTSCLLYRLSESLVYKSNVSPREALLMESAGNLTLRPLSRVIWKESNPNRPTGINSSSGISGRTKAVIMEFGKKFRPSDIPPQRLRNVVIDMFMLVQTLHNQCGIVHGDIKPSNFLWGRDGRLKLADFSSARFMDEDPGLWSDKNVSEIFLTPERMRVREETSGGSGETGNGEVKRRTPPPTVFDDYYALGITLWSIFTGKKPVNYQFNQRNIRKSDLVEVQDDLVRRWIRKVFKMAGCRFW